MSKQEDGMDMPEPFPLHFHWLVGDLHICAGPAASGQPWCLNVDVWCPATGEGERMLWDANSPWGLVRRDPGSSTIMSVDPAPRERDLLIVAEQGIGDIVQQLRYVRPVAAHFCRTRIQCSPELHRFMRRQDWQVEPVHPEQVLADPPKAKVSLMRMGALCADPENGGAYLTARRRPAASRRGLRVGLNWSASRRGVAKDIKSIPLLLLEPLLAAHPDIHWISVQWGDDERLLMQQPWAASVQASGQDVHDVADLADLIAGLDLLITIDSAPAHLAGALGIPVWTLLTQPCSWRWGLGSAQTDLYRCMRLFRQTALHAWPEVLELVSSALASTKTATGSLSEPIDDTPERKSPQHLSAAGTTDPLSLTGLLEICARDAGLRAAFVEQPLVFLAEHGVCLRSRDYRRLNQVFKAMVDFHGGFSWCWPLNSLQSSSFNTAVSS
ncbi:hypothetical protein LKR43_14700 [Pusillimonas sp. MFBS29]|uniref:glycosyltransferase family 9 protein n=1 Tax=Pusillimonas sp. MFBS29 TaxID=2886690 RepID=UPI001D12A6EE|nr:glycosyltransferase family 9 protein [Pusillimonas sp. MFBS29]MCC2597583.1 hypothetical protein [Pusillimonas sp. MFBS29]